MKQHFACVKCGKLVAVDHAFELVRDPNVVRLTRIQHVDCDAPHIHHRPHKAIPKLVHEGENRGK